MFLFIFFTTASLVAWSWWRHQMETFSVLLAICVGNSPVPVNSPHKGQWRGALMFSLVYAWINDWVNNGEAGDLRRYPAHYDVTVIASHACPSARCNCPLQRISKYLTKTFFLNGRMINKLYNCVGMDYITFILSHTCWSALTDFSILDH